MALHLYQENQREKTYNRSRLASLLSSPASNEEKIRICLEFLRQAPNPEVRDDAAVLLNYYLSEFVAKYLYEGVPKERSVTNLNTEEAIREIFSRLSEEPEVEVRLKLLRALDSMLSLYRRQKGEPPRAFTPLFQALDRRRMEEYSHLQTRAAGTASSEERKALAAQAKEIYLIYDVQRLTNPKIDHAFISLKTYFDLVLLLAQIKGEIPDDTFSTWRVHAVDRLSQITKIGNLMIYESTLRGGIIDENGNFVKQPPTVFPSLDDPENLETLLQLRSDTALHLDVELLAFPSEALMSGETADLWWDSGVPQKVLQSLLENMDKNLEHLADLINGPFMEVKPQDELSPAGHILNSRYATFFIPYADALIHQMDRKIEQIYQDPSIPAEQKKFKVENLDQAVRRLKTFQKQGASQKRKRKTKGKRWPRYSLLLESSL